MFVSDVKENILDVMNISKWLKPLDPYLITGSACLHVHVKHQNSRFQRRSPVIWSHFIRICTTKCVKLMYVIKEVKGYCTTLPLQYGERKGD